MWLRWLFLTPAVCLAAGISSVNIVGSTNVQTILSYQAPDNSPCSIEVSEKPGYAPLVHDVDPALFAGANSDNRPGNLFDGTTRAFVIGGRTVGQGGDGKWYSRALQTNTTHYYRLRCGPETATGVFRTANIPTGITYGWPLPQDPATGKTRWPSTDGGDRSQTVIDPNYGTLIKRVSLPGDAPVQADTKNKPFATAAGTNWNNPAAALTDDSGAATYSGTSQNWLVLTDSALKNLADFYVFNNGIDSVQVRIKGSATGADAARTIDVCLTVDGSNCRGEVRRVVLDGSQSTKTLGGGTGIDVWGGDALFPQDLARNPKFGVMIRATNNQQASISIQYVEVDLAISQMMAMPEAGFLQVCSAIPSNRGYHCTFKSSLGTNHMYWIKPETGEVRWLGQVIAQNWGGPQTLCSSTFAFFDVNDPDVYYCEARLNGGAVLLKGIYKGNDNEAAPGGIAPFDWVNLTPAGSTIPDLVKQFNPAYDPNSYSLSLGMMTNQYFVYRAWRTSQDSRAWLAVLDIGNGQPIGSGGTGKIVAAANAFAAPNTRWCGLHTVEFVGHNNWMGWDANTLLSGGNDATGPFTVQVLTDLPASTGRFTIQVNGEPSPHIMDAAVGDAFLLANAPAPGWDFIRIVQKISATQWVVDRTVTNTNATAHPSGTTATAYCQARDLSSPTRGAYVYWDFLNDPNATDTTGKRWVVEKRLTGGHIVQRGDYRIMEAPDGYSVVTPGIPRSFNAQRTSRASGNPQWRGTYANQIPEGLGLGFQQHESYENYLASEPGRANWFLDMIPFVGTSYLVPGITKISGANQVYRLNSTKIHRNLFPTFALCGGRQLKDISPGPIRDSDAFSYCVGSQCASGAGAGDVFVSCPPPVSAKSSCTAFPAGDPSSVCAGDMAPYMQSVTQFFLDPSGIGLRNRVLTNALFAWHGPRTMEYFDTAYSLPDGSWAIFATWGGNGRKDLYMVKIPPQPKFDSNPRWGMQPMQQSFSATPPAGASRVQFAYGDSGALSSVTQPSGCMGGNCSVMIQAPPMSLVFAQPTFLDGSGNKVGDGKLSVKLNGGVSGNGLGKPVLSPRTPVTNAFSFEPNLAPGTIASIFGEDLASCEASATTYPLPTTMCETQVSFNGQPAFLYYTGPYQINAIVPSSISPNQDLSVVVTRTGVASDPFVLPGAQVGPVAPGVAMYTLDGIVFRALVENPDGTTAGPGQGMRPLKVGETATLFAVGLGATTPTVADGQAAPSQPPAAVNAKVEVFVNGFSEPVTFARLAPGSAAVYSVRFKVDAATPLKPNDANEVWVKAGGVESPHINVTLSQ